MNDSLNPESFLFSCYGLSLSKGLSKPKQNYNTVDFLAPARKSSIILHFAFG